jgi:hypothetical protein
MDEEIEIEEQSLKLENAKVNLLNPKKILRRKETKKPQNHVPSFWQAS